MASQGPLNLVHEYRARMLVRVSVVQQPAGAPVRVRLQRVLRADVPALLQHLRSHSLYLRARFPDDRCTSAVKPDRALYS